MVDILIKWGVLMQVEDILFGGGMLVVVVDTLIDWDALAMVVVDAVVVDLQTLELDKLVEEILTLVADYGVHIETVGMARLTVL